MTEATLANAVQHGERERQRQQRYATARLSRPDGPHKIHTTNDRRTAVPDIGRLSHRIDAIIHSLTDVISMLSHLGQIAETRHAAAAHGTAMRTHEDIASDIRARASSLTGVTAAYLSPDGARFLLTGPDWTEELSEAGAELAVALQDKYAPSGDPYIEGGFTDGEKRPGAHWVRVFP